jgi:SAM-dependent methyltransferase
MSAIAMSNSVREHWRSIYRDKSEAQTSWYSAHLDTSLRLLDALHLPKTTPIIDVGGGRSTLADDLLARGFTQITILDIAAPALESARQRLGAAAERVQWRCVDVLEADLPAANYGLWHDRAVFHFLVDPARGRRYVEQAARAVRPGGFAVISTFAPDGPDRCSGLPVRRCDVAMLAAQFAPQFALLSEAREEHTTPWGSIQPFTYAVLRRVESESP